jgi:arylsulfatase
MHWPARIKAKGELRGQFHHVVDVAPTVLESVGVPEPKIVNGSKQRPMEGVGMVYTFDDADAKERHTTQYFEIFGNRAIYHKGWLAGTVHQLPWGRSPLHPLEEDKWELFNTAEDFSLANDLAKSKPEKLNQLQQLFMKEAVRYNVLPIDDRLIERVDPARAGRPDLMGGRKKLTLYSGMEAMMENAFINVKNQSKTITAEIEIPKGPASGVILCQGGRFGGWALYPVPDRR